MLANVEITNILAANAVSDITISQTVTAEVIRQRASSTSPPDEQGGELAASTTTGDGFKINEILFLRSYKRN